LILFCHGFKGFKDWGQFNLMAHFFVEHGFSVLKINFSHNGTTPQSLVDFVDLDAFGNNNFTKEYNDIDDVINCLDTSFMPVEILTYSKLFVLGHSRGGATSILKFLDDQRIDKAATLASVVFIDQRFTKQQVEYWKAMGVIYVSNSRTNQEMPLYYQLVEDVLCNSSRFDIDLRLKGNKKPLLMIHGSEDETVNCQESLAQLNKPNVDVRVINGANHVFGMSYPTLIDELSFDMKTACQMVVDFFEKE
jgi:pimeloyl-ACP methyl ester carboxylesterase